jgi:hypothetical protein
MQQSWLGSKLSLAHTLHAHAECESKRRSALQEVVNFWAARQGLARWLNPAGKRCWLHQGDTLHLAAGLVLGRLHRTSPQPLVGHVAFTAVITRARKVGVWVGEPRVTPTHGTAGLLRGASGLLAPKSGARSSCEHICAIARADTARARVELAAVEQSTAEQQGRQGGVHLVLAVGCQTQCAYTCSEWLGAARDRVRRDGAREVCGVACCPLGSPAQFGADVCSALWHPRGSRAPGVAAAAVVVVVEVVVRRCGVQAGERFPAVRLCVHQATGAHAGGHGQPRLQQLLCQAATST